MKIHSNNDYDRLRSVVVGTAQHANWPDMGLEDNTAWHDTPVPRGAVPQFIIDQAEQDLEALCNIFVQHGVEVYRPDEFDYQTHNKFYGYCPRDRLLILDDKIIVPNMAKEVRDHEIDTYSFLNKCEHVWVDDSNAIFDAANICRINKDLIYLISESGNRAGAEWLQSNFPDYTVHIMDAYKGVHIDSTITVLNENTVVLNAGRITYDNMPKILQEYNTIWITEDDLSPIGFYQYPYASKWMAVNMFSIDPHTVIADSSQPKVIAKLKQNRYNVIATPMTHQRTLGGSFHCCTLDLWREHD